MTGIDRKAGTAFRVRSRRKNALDRLHAQIKNVIGNERIEREINVLTRKIG